jgi:hypothetical protein
MISAVRRFATDNGLDFLQAGPYPEDGSFNVTAAGPDMNFKVIYSPPIDHDQVNVLVYAASGPTPLQRDRAKSFACAVTPGCTGS